MRSFSIRGISTKGFYGPNAKSIGAPFGYGSGNSSGGSGGGAMFTPVATGVFTDPTDDLEQIIIGGNTVLIGSINFPLALAQSLDGGQTWARILPALPNISPATFTQMFVQAGDSSGNFVARGRDSTGNDHILWSNNNGVSWADVTPATLTLVAGSIVHSALLGHFLVADQTHPTQIFTSTNGQAWVRHLLAQNCSFSLLVDGDTRASAFGLQNTAGGAPACWNSADGSTWTREYTSPDSTSTFSGTYAASNGTGTLLVAFYDPGSTTVRVVESTTDGVSWAEISNSNNPNIAPYGPSFAFFQGSFYNGVDGSGLGIAKTPNGTAYTTTPIAVTGVSNAALLAVASDDSTLFAGGVGIAYCTTYPTWQLGLAQTAGFINDLKCGSGYALADGADEAGNPQVWRFVT